MNALFLKDLADKTRRGMRGRVEAGKSGVYGHAHCGTGILNNRLYVGEFVWNQLRYVYCWAERREIRRSGARVVGNVGSGEIGFIR